MLIRLAVLLVTVAVRALCQDPLIVITLDLYRRGSPPCGDPVIPEEWKLCSVVFGQLEVQALPVICSPVVIAGLHRLEDGGK